MTQTQTEVMTATETEVAPLTEAELSDRQKIFDRSLPAAQTMFLRFDAMAQSESGVVKLNWERGKFLLAIREDGFEAEYGVDIEENTVKYTGWTIQQLELCATMASAYDRLDELVALARRQMENGKCPEVGHFIELAKVEDAEKRLELQERMYAESMTDDDLHNARLELGTVKTRVSGSGAQPKAPKTPIAAVRKARKTAVTLVRADPGIAKVLAGGQKMEPDKFDPALRKEINEALDQRVKLSASNELVIAELRKFLNRADSVIGKAKASGNEPKAKKGRKASKRK